MTAQEFYKLQKYDRKLLADLYEAAGNSQKLTVIMDKLAKLRELGVHNFKEKNYEDYL